MQHLSKLSQATVFATALNTVLLSTTALASATLPHHVKGHIEYLSDQGVISSPLSNWPIYNQPIIDELNLCIEESKQTPQVHARCLSVKKMILGRQNRPSVSFTTGNDEPLLSSYQNNSHAEQEIKVAVNFDGEYLSGHLQIARVSDPIDGDESRLDGSYVALSHKNWQLGIGAIDRWWGPSWHSSLILSNNARPAPGLFLSRESSVPFKSQWLSWIGPWSMTTFMNQLESQRTISNALMWGMRVTFRPTVIKHNRLEIGLSRTALWAGDDRPKDLSVFTDMLLGNDNFETDDPGKATEPGDQLGGMDFRYGQPLFSTATMNLYGQVIGEDEAGGLPSRPMALFGGGINTPLKQGHFILFVEASDTALDVFKSDKIFNSAYGHSIYRTGYRYKGRNMGSQYDNDTRAYSLGLRIENSRSSGGIVLSQLELNRDSTSPTKNSVSSTQQDSTALQLDYSYTFHTFRLFANALFMESLPDNDLDVEQRSSLSVGVNIPLHHTR